MPRVNNLQVLRALAATGVAFVHVGQYLHFHAVGSFGVDVFFVISGFVMAQICESGRTEHFLLRRIMRIVPFYWAMTLLLFVLAMTAPGFVRETRANPADLIRSLLFIPFRKATGQLQPLLFLGWSLNYEMYFYCVLAACLRLWPRRAVPLAIAIIVAIMCVCGAFHSVFAEFYGNFMVLEFCAGCLVFYAYRAVPALAARGWRYALCAMAVASAVAVLRPEVSLIYPAGTRALNFGIPAACLVAAFVGLSRGGLDSTSWWLVLVGDASYALYLIHPFVEIGLIRFLPMLLPFLTQNRSLLVACLLAGVICAAVLVYRLVDEPMQKFLSRILKKALTG
jgi:exopolysaccharide production protein ExoZ